VIAVSLSLILASISWHFFERPLLKIKDRIQYARGKMELAEVSS
jgi:peptidoglycan/LPS O-acetylase OafA/YrhL